MIGGLTLAAIGNWFKEFWWVAVALLLAALGIYIDKRARHEQRTKDKAEFDTEAAEAEAAVVKQIQENSDDLLRQSDAVRSHDAASVLPDGSASLPDYHYRD